MKPYILKERNKRSLNQIIRIYLDQGVISDAGICGNDVSEPSTTMQ